MLNRKHVPIPAQMKNLKVDVRGFPIPFVVLIDKLGQPHFKVNDERKSRECIEKKLCHVCGEKLNKDYWFVGGQVSAFHPQGFFVDGPAHKVCALYALKVCPYLAYTQYKAEEPMENIEKLTKKLAGITDIGGLHNPTQSSKRLPFFVLAQAKRYGVKASITGSLFKPDKPYQQIEYWKDGDQILQNEAKLILQKQNDLCYLP